MDPMNTLQERDQPPPQRNPPVWVSVSMPASRSSKFETELVDVGDIFLNDSPSRSFCLCFNTNLKGGLGEHPRQLTSTKPITSLEGKVGVGVLVRTDLVAGRHCKQVPRPL